MHLVARGRVAAQLEAAVGKAEAALQGELIQLRERLRIGEEARQADRQATDALRRQGEAWRQELDDASNEVAKLGERAARVPTLEAELDTLTEQLRLSTEDARRVSASAAQHAETAKQLGDQLSEAKGQVEDLGRRLDTASKALTEANEARATAESQAERLPALERKLADTEADLKGVNAQLTELRESSGAEAGRLNAELTAEREAHGLARQQLASEKSARATAEADVNRLSGELTEAKTHLDNERDNAAQKLQLLTDAKDALSDQFKALASDILEEKSKRFAEQNQASLGQLLDPLKTQLTEFKGKVEDFYVKEGKERTALSEQVRQLADLNRTLSDDAKNLTTALKGENKTQGNWGELVLERVLEVSGLRKGHEYVVQDSQTREDATRAQPDVVIHLPEERRLVIDAKVSLVAYEELTKADSDEARVLAVRRHLDSVRGHIKALSEKRYQALYGLQSLDFVLLFVPIEPAFMAAVSHDSALFMDAWDRNVLLVSPSTLLFVVRTVAHLWRQESQSKNAQDIAKRGADLYEKLHDFVKDLETVGNRLRQAQEAFDAAQKRLSTGRGNVIRQAEMLRELGVKPAKVMAGPLVEAAMQDPLILVPEPSVQQIELRANSATQVAAAAPLSSAEG
ncbi:DNA recombination protein RmuC [Variovorax paradoxus]|nr:DNA recombination protein RmuC [Variovorax paradoxus]